MTILTEKKSVSLRNAIDENCRNCIYDDKAEGTWRQQVTLCSVTSCAIYPVRPVTKSQIPESTLDYYNVTGAERERYALKNTLKGPLSEHNPVKEYRDKGQHAMVSS